MKDLSPTQRALLLNLIDDTIELFTETLSDVGEDDDLEIDLQTARSIKTLLQEEN